VTHVSCSDSVNHRHADVLIIGAGPAGCAAARLLAAWGHDVLLVTKPASNAARLAESIPPSARKLFDVLGVREAFESADVVRSTGNTVWWGDREMRVESFASGERGWQVTGDIVERILQDAVRVAGARVEHRRVDAEDAVKQRAAFTLDCSGRTGVLARSRRVHEPSQRTVALIGVWRPGARFSVPDRTHTLVESYENGWAWSVPDAAGRRFVAVMVDPQTSALARDRTSRAVYEEEVARTRRFRALLQDAILDDGPFGWDASMYSSTQYAEDSALLVGDAGSFIDPLSSAGVKKALASGWLAAVVTHTCLARPHMRQVALEFFSEREAEMYASFRALTREFLAAAAAGHSHPFWTDRAEHEGARDDFAVKAAFERIRAEPSLSVTRGPDLRVADRAAVSANEIVLEARLVTDRDPRGRRYAFDVDLIALVDLAPSFTQVPDAFDAYNKQHAPVALPNFLGALATAIAKGWLVWRS